MLCPVLWQSRSDGVLTGKNLVVEEVLADQRYSLRFADSFAAMDVPAILVRGDALALASVIREGGYRSGD